MALEVTYFAWRPSDIGKVDALGPRDPDTPTFTIADGADHDVAADKAGMYLLRATSDSRVDIAKTAPAITNASAGWAMKTDAVRVHVLGEGDKIACDELA
ncbi:hypothetical protein ACRAQ6_13865 [Erythrobacter sp. HA6-11]